MLRWRQRRLRLGDGEPIAEDGVGVGAAVAAAAPVTVHDGYVTAALDEDAGAAAALDHLHRGVEGVRRGRRGRVGRGRVVRGGGGGLQEGRGVGGGSGGGGHAARHVAREVFGLPGSMVFWNENT